MRRLRYRLRRPKVEGWMEKFRKNRLNVLTFATVLLGKPRNLWRER